MPKIIETKTAWCVGCCLTVQLPHRHALCDRPGCDEFQAVSRVGEDVHWHGVPGCCRFRYCSEECADMDFERWRTGCQSLTVRHFHTEEEARP